MTAPIKTRLLRTVGDLDLHETTDGQRSLYVTRTGEKKPIAGAWGPAADSTGNWFAWRDGVDPVRVESHDAAVEYITAPVGAGAR